MLQVLHIGPVLPCFYAIGLMLHVSTGTKLQSFTTLPRHVTSNTEATGQTRKHTHTNTHTHTHTQVPSLNLFMPLETLTIESIVI